MTALRAGPLAGQDLSLLTEMSVLSRPSGCLATIDRLDKIGNGLTGIIYRVGGQPGGRGYPEDFTYIGERQDDGFVAAPEGGWESNPVPGRRAFYRYRADGDPLETDQALPSDKQDWEWINDGYDDIIAFRLAGEAVSIPEGEGGALAPLVPTEEPSPPVVVTELIEAARAYFMGWAQDEADDEALEWVGCPVAQHDAAKRLKLALADYDSQQGASHD